MTPEQKAFTNLASAAFGQDFASLLPREGVSYDEALEHSFAELRDRYYSLMESNFFSGGNSLRDCMERLDGWGLRMFDREWDDEISEFVSWAPHNQDLYSFYLLESADSILILAYPKVFSEIGTPAEIVDSVYVSIDEDPCVIVHEVMTL